MGHGRKLIARFTAAVGLAGLARLGLEHALPGELSPDLAVMLCNLLQFGLLGLFQGWSLSNHGRIHAGALAGCSALAALLWFGLSRFVTDLPVPRPIVEGLFIGALLGCLQLALLWRLFKPAILWPVATALAFGAGAAISFSATLALGELGTASGALQGGFDVLASMIIGGISGVAAFKLLRQGESHDPARRVNETGEGHRS